jgi:hypothetical protein
MEVLMNTEWSGGVERSTVTLAAAVAGAIIIASVLGISGWGVRALRWLVLDGPLEAAILIAWVVLVLLRNPYPGFDPVAGRLSRSHHRRKLLAGIRTINLLLVVLLLGAGLGLRTVLTQVPGLQILLVVAVALGCVGMVARRRPVSDVSRIELVVAVPFTFGFAAELLASGGPGTTTFDWAIAGAGAVAVAAGVAIAIGLPIRPPTPFDDPLKLILGGGAALMTGAVPTMSMMATPVLALLVMPTIVAVVELALLTQSGTVGRRGRGVPVLDILAEPAGRMERELRRIKGTYRRLRSRDLVESGELPAPEMLTHELDEHLKLALQMQVSSQARGGEDLPDLLDGEVEIARITYTQTVHGEVVSLRAIRAGDDRLALRLVDEYETEFALPFDEVDGSISAEQVAMIFLTSEPSPTNVGPFQVLSDVIPDIQTAFRMAMKIADTITAPSGIGAAIRSYFALTAMGAVAATRKTLDFRGLAISYEARFYGFGVVVTRSVINMFLQDLSLLLWALWIPVPALVVRRIRTIGLDTIRGDALQLLLAAAGAGVLGAIVFDLPIWFGALTIGPSILMLYLMFRQGPTERAILSPEWNSQR